MKADILNNNKNEGEELIHRNIAIMSLLLVLVIIGTVIVFEVTEQNNNVKFIPPVKDFDYFRNQGGEMFIKGNYQQAEELYLEAYLMNPNDLETLQSLGVITFSQKKWNESIEYFEKFLRQQQTFDVMFFLARAYYNEAKYNKGLSSKIKSELLNRAKDRANEGINSFKDVKKQGLFNLILAALYLETEDSALCKKHFVYASELYQSEFETILKVKKNWMQDLLQSTYVIDLVKEGKVDIDLKQIRSN